MAERDDTMMNPKVEDLLDRSGSKFTLVSLAARRARQINSYFHHLGEGLGSAVPPQVTSVARKPLTIAFEEIAADKIEPRLVDPTEAEAAAVSPEQAEFDAVMGDAAPDPDTDSGG